MPKDLTGVRPLLRRWISRALEIETTRPYYYLGNRRAMIELHDGSPFVIDTESLDISTDLIRRGRWEDWIEPHITNSVGPGSVFVDVGANMGYYSIVVGRVVGPTGRVYAYEPNPSLYGLLKKNFFINGLNGEAFPCALGRERRDATLWARTVDSGGGYLSNDPNCDATGSGHAGMPIEVRALDDILSKDTQIDSMKIDVEGHEPEVVAGAEHAIKRSHGLKMFIELNPQAWVSQGYDPKVFLGGLASMGFDFRILLPEGVKLCDAAQLIGLAGTLPFTTSFMATRPG
jgi:FkbM family methyltransferase